MDVLLGGCGPSISTLDPVASPTPRYSVTLEGIVAKEQSFLSLS